MRNPPTMADEVAGVNRRWPSLRIWSFFLKFSNANIPREYYSKYFDQRGSTGVALVNTVPKAATFNWSHCVLCSDGRTCF